MLRDVLVLRRRGAHAFVINAGSHVDHEIRVAWFSNSMHACGSAPLIINNYYFKSKCTVAEYILTLFTEIKKNNCFSIHHSRSEAVGLLRLMISVIAKEQHPETAPKKNVGESSYKTSQAKFHSLPLYIF